RYATNGEQVQGELRRARGSGHFQERQADMAAATASKEESVGGKRTVKSVGRAPASAFVTRAQASLCSSAAATRIAEFRRSRSRALPVGYRSARRFGTLCRLH